MSEEPRTSPDQDNPENKPPKRRRLKLKIALGVVAFLVLIFGGSGIVYATQHGNPHFCNFICHSPMDPYVEGYYSDDAALLITSHMDAGETCVDCHTPNMEQQIDEGIKWATGDFKDPMALRRFGTTEFCLQPGCHTDYDDYASLAAATANYQGSGFNPHKGAHGELECYTCHSVHDKSRLYCKSCHAEMPVPADW